MSKFLIMLLLGMTAMPASAIVNLTHLHTSDLEPGFQGEVAASWSGSDGNTEKQNAGFSSNFLWHGERYTNLLLMDYRYGESAGVTDTRNGFVHARHIHPWTARTDWEVFTQVQMNEFARLSLRQLAGGGLRFDLGVLDTSYLGMGAFYEHEQLLDPTVDEEEHSYLWRGNLYIILKASLTDTVSLYNTSYYQPALDDGEDYRVLEQAGMSVKLAEQLSLTISVNASYDQQPPLGVERNDVSYRTGLNYRF